jgi:UPF0176 protein
MKHVIVLFYNYINIEKPLEAAAFVRGLCAGAGVKGRVIIAEEGINATFEGTEEAIERVRTVWLQDIHFKKILKKVDWKTSPGTGTSFPRLSVKVRPEIVASTLTDTNPNKLTGKYLKPSELNKLYEKGEDFVVVDMRNDYEYKVGHFRNSINPGMQNFRDLPKVLPKLNELKNKKVVTVCTGGVRCEKASGYLLQNGFTDVYQLHGGMHRYMEKYGNKDFLGKLYVFDGRVVSGGEGVHDVVGRCQSCRNHTERYINCAKPECHDHILQCERCATENKGYCSKGCKESIIKVVTH